MPYVRHLRPLDLHQKDEPMEQLAYKANGAVVRKSQSAIGNWDSHFTEGSCVVLLFPRPSGKQNRNSLKST